MLGGLVSRLRSLLITRTDRITIQVLRSIAASHLGFWADLATLVLLTEVLGLYYLVSAVFAFAIGNSVIYAFSVIWVFKHRRIKNRIAEFVAFCLIGVIGMGVMLGTMWSFTELLHLHYVISKTISGVFVFLVSFSLRKFLLFHPPGGRREFEASDPEGGPGPP
jgi:putative flippase GtrA